MNIQKYKKTIAALLSLFSMGSVMAFPCDKEPQNYHQNYLETAGLDTELYINDLKNSLSAHGVKGFVSTVRDKNGQIVVNLRKGLARTECDTDGQINFSSSTETPWGSISKLITTVAAIKAADEYGVSLQSKMMNFLPLQWRVNIHPRFADVTLEDFLNHQAGFRHSSCGGRSVSDRLEDGDLANCQTDPSESPTDPPPEVGTRSYANMLGIYSHGILAYMIAPEQMLAYDTAVLSSFAPYEENFSQTEYDELVTAYAGQIYINYIKQSIFDPIGISATCNMASNLGGNYTLWFSSAEDSSGTLPHDRRHDCGSGAWIMSSNEMSWFLHKLNDGYSILTHDQYQLMETNWTDSLGWTKGSWQVGDVYSHGGSWGSTKAWVLALPGEFTATLVFNTPIDENEIHPGTALKNAFEAARIAAVSDAHSILNNVVISQ